MRAPSNAFWVLLIAGAAGCASSNLPRNVRETFHKNHPECRGRDIQGEPIGEHRYRVHGCGHEATYVCPVGAHSRWKRCEVE